MDNDPMHRNRTGVAGISLNWFSMQAVLPSLVHHQKTVASMGSGRNGSRSRLRLRFPWLASAGSLGAVGGKEIAGRVATAEVVMLMIASG